MKFSIVSVFLMAIPFFLAQADPCNPNNEAWADALIKQINHPDGRVYILQNPLQVGCIYYAAALVTEENKSGAICKTGLVVSYRKRIRKGLEERIQQAPDKLLRDGRIEANMLARVIKYTNIEKLPGMPDTNITEVDPQWFFDSSVEKNGEIDNPTATECRVNSTVTGWEPARKLTRNRIPK